ncbi:hypothetical protein AALP_AA2G012700 [Arabis alpina]|uniref:Bifunctional inhibitor/plant lipid transfer protein/seed storage helical domain-containing protein n=1 Tax=Arabis alpina TaxID=50452 RepID=A0A087HEL3_ARAAL|nr:hypothetical protein AALP_AA2G012700 [Arabis alpina]
MTRFPTMMIFAIALISLAAVESQTTTCVSKLVPCFSALNTTTTPPKDCCDSIKDAVKNDLPCLCTVYTTPGLLAQFNVNTTQALGISDRCGVKTDLSACPSGSGSPSPKASLSPPATGSKGKDAGAGNKLAGYGITTVILSLVSTIFF